MITTSCELRVRTEGEVLKGTEQTSRVLKSPLHGSSPQVWLVASVAISHFDLHFEVRSGA